MTLRAEIKSVQHNRKIAIALAKAVLANGAYSSRFQALWAKRKPVDKDKAVIALAAAGDKANQELGWLILEKHLNELGATH